MITELLTVACSIWMASNASYSAAQRLDEIPTNHVERAVGVVIRKNKVRISYALGVNVDTIGRLLKKPADTAATNQSDSEPTLSERSEIESSSNDMVSVDSTFARLNRHLIRQAPGLIEDGLSIQLDGKALKFDSVSVEPYPKHHLNLVVHFTLTLPKTAKESVKLVMQDKGFSGFDGAVRYALKSIDGGPMVVRSNVAPIIVRAKRVSLNQLTDKQRMSTCRIEATLAFPNIGAGKEK